MTTWDLMLVLDSLYLKGNFLAGMLLEWLDTANGLTLRHHCRSILTDIHTVADAIPRDLLLIIDDETSPSP